MESILDYYRNKRVLITGHSGFKGSWLSLWLRELGACLSGISLERPSHPCHWDMLSLDIDEEKADIRDYDRVLSVFKRTRPEIVFHLAAQPLVRRSYIYPLETWETNVIGTANILEACRMCKSVQAVVVITSDKCYENKEWDWGYRETDRLGGYDPYSASKAAVELLTSSYRQAFFSLQDKPLIATARAGNVIGGGDWAENRLIPDIVRSVVSKTSLEVRCPTAKRPWQHVLEPLAGYLILGQKLLAGKKEFATAWNFGPKQEANKTVKDILLAMKVHWPDIQWHISEHSHNHEANLLYLDSSKAENLLNWQSIWSLDTAITKTVDWYKSYIGEKQIVSLAHINDYMIHAQEICIPDHLKRGKGTGEECLSTYLSFQRMAARERE